MNKRNRQQVFRDPIYGYIHIDYPIITELIDSKAFQRLRRIRQLSGVHMVFHGAEHSRFTHSLGVYELAYRFSKIKDISEQLDQRSELLFLATALLHDIGHGAYSHAFEYVFNVDHEKIGARLIVTDQELTSILAKIDNEFASDIASILLKEGKYPLIEQLISSQLDIDRLDYLERDAYFTGAAYGHIDLDRLMRIVRVKDKKLTFKASGIHAIENYLVARYHMYWQVYYHPKARAYEVILEKIYLRIKDLLKNNYDFGFNVNALQAILNNPMDLDNYFKIDDYYMNGLIAHLVDSKDQILRNLSNDFLNRHIWAFIDDTKANKQQINQIIDSFSKEEQKYYTHKTNVKQSAYLEDALNLGDQIYILTEDDKIIPLSSYSSIVHSLLTSSIKSDPKFFYRQK